MVQYGQAFQLKSRGQRGRVLEDILPTFSQVSPPEVLPGYHNEDKNLFMLPAGNGKPSHFEIHPENFFFKACPQRKLFYQNLTSWDFTKSN